MDALEQLTTVIIPNIIGKIKEQKATLADVAVKASDAEAAVSGHADRLLKLEETAELMQQKVSELVFAQEELGKATRKMYEAMMLYKERIEKLEAAKPAPEVKVRRTRKKKAANEPKGETFSAAELDGLTGDDIMSANYALAATKGDVDEACTLMPDVERHKIELVSRMTSEQIRSVTEATGTTILNIDSKLANARWDEVAG